MKLVVALGGHALAPPGVATLADQHAALRCAAHEIAALAREHALVVTHGNGPQIGWLANAQRSGDEPARFDALGAESEGLLGYWLAQELRNELPGREVVALLTLAEVDAHDPAFAAPSKPIGPVLTRAEAERLAALGLPCAPDRGGFRRVIASPEPLRILELRSIELLWSAGCVVVCAGGGGIPVARDAGGRFAGAPAVIDKDRSAALLASQLGADGLLLLTDVPAIYADWPLRDQPIRCIAAEELAQRRFERGSMAPKAEAASRFARAPGQRAWIGALDDARAILRGEAGTAVLCASEAQIAAAPAAIPHAPRARAEAGR
ncbi:MAG TPA: carbamate kinase [Myxococcota bacterium]|jgi:carbamate kinase